MVRVLSVARRGSAPSLFKPVEADRLSILQRRCFETLPSWAAFRTPNDRWEQEGPQLLTCDHL